ncbi:U6 snRNA phosphodiesterase [Heracleum sosnowskyi]|uniref:U6 snRNA phosphodiesterase n=1 Tax=Heracleum sosnowskyi TaxID=360622 RepID=A0AAD8HFZ9_9APIA|nr:U6 snRNA phosphodiesterase [Heracleum sosnowskyi]
MEALIASYSGDTSSDSDSNQTLPESTTTSIPEPSRTPRLPPPPVSLLKPPTSLRTLNRLETSQVAPRVRSFAHVDGNYALHVYIPVRIPSSSKEKLARFIDKVSSLVPGLNVVDADIPLDIVLKNNKKLEEIALGREFHISLGRTVPIRVHQIESVLSMLRQKPQLRRRDRYLISFDKWEVFVNDDHTRSFLSIEVMTGGLAEITRQIQAVNEVYKLHSLPEFYKDPRPHISIAWALGDISESLKRVVEREQKSCFSVGESSKRSLFTCKFGEIECKIGSKVYKICKSLEE